MLSEILPLGKTRYFLNISLVCDNSVTTQN